MFNRFKRATKSIIFKTPLRKINKIPVVPSDVLLTTYNLKPKLSQGYNGIFTKLIKETISNILQPITHVINISFVTGIVPQDLKIAKVIPIYKNYRSVAYYQPFSKY